MMIVWFDIHLQVQNHIFGWNPSLSADNLKFRGALPRVSAPTSDWSNLALFPTPKPRVARARRARLDCTL